MVPSLWCCKGEQRGGEEHGFIVRMGDQEADAFATDVRGGGPRYLGGVEPTCREEDWDGEIEVGGHSETGAKGKPIIGQEALRVPYGYFFEMQAGT